MSINLPSTAQTFIFACTRICDSFLACARAPHLFLQPYASLTAESLAAKMAAVSAACQQRIALNDGRQMPSFGLGVWQAPLGQCKAAVLHALRCGYRHIDTAEIYGNEQDVGDALAIFLKERPDVQREDIWITTKFFPRHGAGRAAVVRACKDSLRKLRLQYVDLYLIHAPHTRERIEQYRALEALRAEGLCRSIGVSNYGIHHLEELLAVCTVPPCVNQVRGSASGASTPSTRRFHR